MPKERIEDLGRLAELLKIIRLHPIFEMYQGRTKDFGDWLNSLSEEKKEDVVHEIGYGLKDIEEKIAECECIARGLED